MAYNSTWNEDLLSSVKRVQKLKQNKLVSQSLVIGLVADCNRLWLMHGGVYCNFTVAFKSRTDTDPRTNLDEGCSDVLIECPVHSSHTVLQCTYSEKNSDHLGGECSALAGHF